MGNTILKKLAIAVWPMDNNRAYISMQERPASQSFESMETSVRAVTVRCNGTAGGSNAPTQDRKGIVWLTMAAPAAMCHSISEHKSTACRLSHDHRLQMSCSPPSSAEQPNPTSPSATPSYEPVGIFWDYGQLILTLLHVPRLNPR